jgi:hypothetical protein
MPFTATTRLPLYVSATGVTLRITAPGSPTRVNGVADDAMADDADGVFVATVAEDLVGTFEYVIYRSGTPIQSGWLKRIADQASVILDDPRDDFTGISTTLGTPAGASIAADIAAVAANMPTLSGPYTRTLTIVDSDTDEPIELASVRFFRTGETETQVTDADGEVAFTVEAATWSYAVTASGYSGTTGTIAVSATGSTEIQLTAASITLPDNPALATLPIRCLDEAGAPEADVTIYARLVKIPTGSTGISFDGVSQSDTSDVNGDASLTVVKSATYEIRRGESKVWHTRVMTSADVQAPMSFIGADPA